MAVVLHRRTEVQTQLNISRATFLRWVNSGQLPAVKVGREWKVRSDVIEEIQQHGLPQAE